MKLGYHLALRVARLRRAIYRWRLHRIARRPLTSPAAAEASFYSFSGTRDLPEQVASLRSFLRHAGTPRRIVVVGDGTHSPADEEALRSLHPGLDTLSWREFVRSDLPPRMQEYAQAHPLGKKVAVLMSLPAGEPLVFSDSDILYFPAARDVRERMAAARREPEFLEDCYPSLDKRLVLSEEEHRPPVNSGFILLRQPLDWSLALERLDGMSGTPGYFTEQTLFHLAVRRSGGRPLPRETYVIESDDQWYGRDAHTGPGVVLRHYFSSIRYKMWLKTPLAG